MIANSRNSSHRSSHKENCTIEKKVAEVTNYYSSNMNIHNESKNLGLRGEQAPK